MCILAFIEADMLSELLIWLYVCISSPHMAVYMHFL